MTEIAYFDNPPSDDPYAPACWSWGPPPTKAEYRRSLEEPGKSGDINLTLSPSTIDRIMSAWDDARFDVFHRERCAICGIKNGTEVDDHDHKTGFRRGWLCRSCNVREGVSGHPFFVNYRKRNPATILGVQLPYTGYGWENGVPIGGWPEEREYDRWRDNPLKNVGL